MLEWKWFTGLDQFILIIDQISRLLIHVTFDAEACYHSTTHLRRTFTWIYHGSQTCQINWSRWFTAGAAIAKVYDVILLLCCIKTSTSFKSNSSLTYAVHDKTKPVVSYNKLCTKLQPGPRSCMGWRHWTSADSLQILLGLHWIHCSFRICMYVWYYAVKHFNYLLTYLLIFTTSAVWKWLNTNSAAIVSYSHSLTVFYFRPITILCN